MKHTIIRTTAAAVVGLVIAAGGIYLSHAPAVSSASAPLTSPRPLPPGKQAIFNHMIDPFTSPNPNAPRPLGPGQYHSHPCVRDLSVSRITGVAPAGGQLDNPNWRAYAFNNAWSDPAGVYFIQAGNVRGTSQGVVTVETWKPVTACLPAQTVYLAPANSGSLTVVRATGSTVILSGSNGTPWTFSLAQDKLEQG